ncbi:hypothetical protein OG979_19160 [Actinomadura citrea]|uniref:hypothetical protein n=1 Tax=Actinomadura citrea TaxID=46158 RepID=UPI002E2B3ADD|nr:hypothetical protein [Actinomadura citrea]
MTNYTPGRAAASNDEETVQLAANLHEHVRQLNYATSGPPSLTQAARGSARAFSAAFQPGLLPVTFGRFLQWSDE